MKVWVYPEKTHEEFGAERWEVEWQELTKSARARYDADPMYEHDPDCDDINVCRVFKARAAAVKYAEKVYKTSVYGCAMVTKQVVDWYVEADRVAEWTNVGEPEEVAG